MQLDTLQGVVGQQKILMDTQRAQLALYGKQLKNQDESLSQQGRALAEIRRLQQPLKEFTATATLSAPAEDPQIYPFLRRVEASLGPHSDLINFSEAGIRPDNSIAGEMLLANFLEYGCQLTVNVYVRGTPVQFTRPGRIADPDMRFVFFTGAQDFSKEIYYSRSPDNDLIYAPNDKKVDIWLQKDTMTSVLDFSGATIIVTIEQNHGELWRELRWLRLATPQGLVLDIEGFAKMASDNRSFIAQIPKEDVWKRESSGGRGVEGIFIKSK